MCFMESDWKGSGIAPAEPEEKQNPGTGVPMALCSPRPRRTPFHLLMGAATTWTLHLRETLACF